MKIYYFPNFFIISSSYLCDITLLNKTARPIDRHISLKYY